MTEGTANGTEYVIEGSYYEACNCNAICPCRRTNGVAQGRSTFGICDFLLSWKIDKGQASGIDLSGLGVAMAGSYSDDEDGSPWRVVIYIDERANDAQFKHLHGIFSGQAGGNILFTKCISAVLAVKRAAIELDHSSKAEIIRIGEMAAARVVSPIEFDGTVTCGISGHDRPGQESVSSLHCKDGPLEWDYEERCGFATGFAYSS